MCHVLNGRTLNGRTGGTGDGASRFHSPSRRGRITRDAGRAQRGASSPQRAATRIRRYLAWRHDAIAGGGGLRLAGGVAELSGASTLPDHRRHGVQTALLHHRLAEAVRAGCDIAVVTTEPGSKSQQNVQRQGFSLLYARAVLIRG